MNVSYKKLWKLLIDRDMTKTDLRLAVGASSSTFAKLAKGEYISGDLMVRICRALACNVGDIMDIVLDGEEQEVFSDRKDTAQCSRCRLARERAVKKTI